MVEVVSYYDRLWNFNQTGNIAVLPYTAFKALGIYDHIRDTGWPYLGPLYNAQSTLADLIPHLDPCKAPVHPKTQSLILSGMASINHWYGESTAQVSQNPTFQNWSV